MNESRIEMLNSLLDQWHQVSEVLDGIAAELKPYQDKQAELREMIVNLGLELGPDVVAGIEHENVKLQYRQAHQRKTWDTKALLGYAEHDEKIKKFLVVSDVDETIAVSLRKKANRK